MVSFGVSHLRKHQQGCMVGWVDRREGHEAGLAAQNDLRRKKGQTERNFWVEKE